MSGTLSEACSFLGLGRLLVEVSNGILMNSGHHAMQCDPRHRYPTRQQDFFTLVLEIGAFPEPVLRLFRRERGGEA